MTVLILAALATQPPTITEREMVEQAVYECPHAEPDEADPYLLLGLLRAEEHAGVPEAVRGITLAAACRESGFRADARGDAGKAHGIFQLWPWAERYGVDRDDPASSVWFWLGHMQRQVPKVRKRCGYRNVMDVWRAAGAYAVRAPKEDRCRERTSHWRILRRWQRS